ncbi:glucose 1-dehydrogenase [Halieaceae bacterium IMCC14734]|uniref:Glucose 1-dehydrogenase n=1 Tax=Candidatus Litorirhabdus singularis TaxID=2518993 RepID=A0ABT3TG04_9GAMM|nr:glucose 1-dehydrogenase [Candidatus Litorirhabdus singularis]MCX2980354.1 glucose 1-dehydrogenase [Candidatus Litorirhabdus singularis]
MVEIDLSGKVALVTGGSRGLGRAMSLGLADAGADVVVASRKLESCEAVCAEIAAKGRRGLPVSAHVGDTESLDRLIATALEAFGKIDILINNAGINPAMGALSDLSPELFQKMFDVNLKGPWYLASRLAPHMAASGGGSIINLVSVGGLRPSAWQGFYATTKAGLDAMTRVMAAEWADGNVRVNALAPGSFHSDLFDTSAELIPGFEEGAKAASLQKRIADTEEIVGPVLYLASDMSKFTTGTTVVADGGFLAL